jgi:thiol-disulfide isomerase/thioredoxin
MRFRHEIKDDLVAANTGAKVYLYLPAQNVYTEGDAPADRGSFSSLPDQVRSVLRAQDWSLVFALSDDAAMELISGATSVSASDAVIDGRKFPAVTASFTETDVTVILDPATHLARRVIIDESRGLKMRGADVKAAQITIDYTTSVPDAAVAGEQLAFTLPATAQEQEVETADAMSLIGKAAPHFRLAELDGTEVSDRQLHGSVYVLDFWASWCGPCMMSLPETDELYKQMKGGGLKVFAVNVQEGAAGVKDVIGRLNLSLPVLLDTDAKAAVAYGATAIPETVVVGRDGVVRNVFVGAGQAQDIAAAVTAALSGVAAAPPPAP